MSRETFLILFLEQEILEEGFTLFFNLRSLHT